MIRVADRVALSYETTERPPEDDRTFDAERVAQTAHVVSPHVERPTRRIVVAVAAAVSPMIQVHDLRDLSEPRVHRLETRVVKAGPTVEQHDCRTLAHDQTISDDPCAFDVEVKRRAVHPNPHGRRVPTTLGPR